MQAFVGLAEATAEGFATFGSGGLAAPIGWPILAHGLDQLIAGMDTAITGKPRATLTEQLLQTTGMPADWASFTNDALSIGGTMGGSALIRISRIRSFPRFDLSSHFSIETINPHTIRFSQSSIKNKFQNGMTIDDLAVSLKNGSIGVGDITPIRLIKRNNLLYTLDNRRLEAFRRAGVKIPYKMATEQEVANEIWKFSNKDGGVFVKIRGQ